MYIPSNPTCSGGITIGDAVDGHDEGREKSLFKQKTRVSM
jgi:hypothetical protein